MRCAVSSAFSPSDISGTAPRPSRSSGTNARPRAPSRLRSFAADRLAMQPHARIDHEALAGDRREQLLLAVAGHAGDADDLADVHGQRDVGERDAERVVGRQRQRVDRKPRLAQLRGAMARTRQVAADHQPRERRGRLLAADRNDR